MQDSGKALGSVTQDFVADRATGNPILIIVWVPLLISYALLPLLILPLWSNVHVGLHFRPTLCPDVARLIDVTIATSCQGQNTHHQRYLTVGLHPHFCRYTEKIIFKSKQHRIDRHIPRLTS